MPTLATLAVGTRSVILSFMKLITNNSSFSARDLLVLDGQDLADAVGGIDDEFVGPKTLALGQNLFRFLDLGRDRGRLYGRALLATRLGDRLRCGLGH